LAITSLVSSFVFNPVALAVIPQNKYGNRPYQIILSLPGKKNNT